MSLQPAAVGPVPEDTARVARAAFPKGNLYLRLRDELGSVYEDETFASLFPSRGQPAEAPWRLALVLVFQFAEGLSDRQAADAVRGRIDWKYVLGLELTDPGFDASVLSEFRTRVVAGAAEQQFLDAQLVRCRQIGLLKPRGKQRTDSTHVLAASRWLNRLTCVGETLRQALNRLARVAPEWLRGNVEPAWLELYGPRFEDFRLPKDKSARAALAEQIGADGHRLLTALWAPAAPAGLRDLPAVETLRRVWVQEYYAPEPDGQVRWRAVEDLPPAALLINSPYDDEARYSSKRDTTWTGYKVHLTETCDPDQPHLITQVETTPATTPDWHLAPVIHAALARKDLLPSEHLVDAGYVDSEVIVSSQADHQLRVIGPVPPDSSWQAQAAQGFEVACFRLDWDARRATCPTGQTSTKWAETHDRHGAPTVTIRFSSTACRACPRRADCTSSPDGPRQLTVRPRLLHEALQAGREYQTTPALKAEYALRAGIEGTLSQGVRVADLRQARYFGLAKTHLQHVLTGAALNLRRLGAWWDERTPAATRRSPFVALATPGL